MYFSGLTGKLAAVLAVQDVALPSAASAVGLVSHSVQGDRLVVEGQFSAVLDAAGRNLAPDGATRVVLDENGQPVDVQ